MTTPTDTHESEGTSVSQIVGRLAWALSHELSPGDVAALRRHRVERPLAPAFFRVAALVLEPAHALPSWENAREASEDRWAIIIAAIAQLEGLHAPRRRLGTALAEAGFSEQRFLRLLRAHDDALADAVATTAHFLSSGATEADLSDLALLVLSDGRSDEERVRRRIARTFFANTTI